ncbi:vacuolar protein sorting-associated protein 33A isoform X2 [Macrosteles quadrilineatus]|uniref:vacuolar protein sorting-associated protein 33A isoform X2 n=1 Tax=Macrosteles quadrilineatus TaxID=74068 RepID=UPI0023E348D8|nr:vacuolar protein sorting-associated protein 33A isoform X2 [Macrosteles quadrilineatus]
MNFLPWWISVMEVIVLDEDLNGPIGLVAKSSDLQAHGISKAFILRGGRLPLCDARNVIFITRPLLKLMDLISENIHGEEKSKVRKEFHIIFVPRKSLLCEKRLKNKGVFGNLNFIDELPCDIFPFDSDLMSMELPHAFKEFHLENDPSTLYQAAQAIMTLQDMYGVIPRVCGKGVAAQHVWDLICRLSLEPRPGRQTTAAPHIDQLLLLDRAVDTISPLATQLTYEGLIDEFFGICNTTVHLPAHKFAQSDDEPQSDMIQNKKKVVLNSGDQMFAEIRDKNFNAVGPALSKKAKLISSQLDERHGDKTIQEMKQFVARLSHLMATKKSLATHTTIAEMIKEVTDSTEFLDTLRAQQEMMLCVDTDKVQPYIEDCIAHKESLVKVLRLICLQSATNSGLKQKVLDYYKREIVQAYGFHHILTLTNLEKAGLLKLQDRHRVYPVVRKLLRLTVEDGNEVAPTDMSYVHSVYAPLSARLAQHMARNSGWRNLADVLPLLPGPTLDETQATGAQPHRRGSIDSKQSTGSDVATKVILVFFLGGCTFAEISALRFLSHQPDSNVEFLIATTKLINGNTFIESLMEPLPVPS